MGLWASGVDPDPGATSRLGGAQGGSASDQNALEDDMHKRYGFLGAATPTPGLAPWLTGEQNTTGQWVDQSRGSQQDAYNLANAMGQGGSTPQQQMLAQNYGIQNAGLQGMAAGAGGGARGAAAAQGNAAMMGGANQGVQQGGMDMQRQSDMMQGQALAAQASNQMRAGDQGALANQNANAVNNAQFQQGWTNQNANNQLWAGGMDQKAMFARMGLSSDALDRQLAQSHADQLANQQLVGAGLQAVGTAAAGYGKYADAAAKKPNNGLDNGSV